MSPVMEALSEMTKVLHEAPNARCKTAEKGNLNSALDVGAGVPVVCVVASGVGTNAKTNVGLSKDCEKVEVSTVEVNESTVKVNSEEVETIKSAEETSQFSFVSFTGEGESVVK